MSEQQENTALGFVHKVFPAGHFVISMMFVVCSIALLVFAVVQFSAGANPAADFPIQQRVNLVLEGISLLVVSVAALVLGQSLLEEEVQRRAHMSAPTRVRRCLLHFMFVHVVSISFVSM